MRWFDGWLKINKKKSSTEMKMTRHDLINYLIDGLSFHSSMSTITSPSFYSIGWTSMLGERRDELNWKLRKRDEIVILIWKSKYMKYFSSIFRLFSFDRYDGDIYLTIILNGLVHTIMYTYYFVSMHTKVRKREMVNMRCFEMVDERWDRDKMFDDIFDEIKC